MKPRSAHSRRKAICGSTHRFSGVFIILLLLLYGCEDEKPPVKGNVTLTVDWSGKGAGIETPLSYEAVFVPETGNTQKFTNLSEASNKLAIEPGPGQLIVYTLPAGLEVEGTTARIAVKNNLIPASTGWFFCRSERLDVEPETDMAKTVRMKQQMRELNISVAITPTESLSFINKISATLSGAASEVNIISGAVAVAATAAVDFSINNHLATGKTRLLGLMEGSTATLSITVELEGGGIANEEYDISALLGDFNATKTTPLYIKAEMEVDQSNRKIATEDWQQGSHSAIFSVSPLLLEFEGNDENVEEISVVSSDNAWNYEVVQTGDWCKVEKTGNRMKVAVTPNPGQAREAKISITSVNGSETVTVFQTIDNAIFYYQDGEAVQLQNATAFGSNSKGVNIVIMGDGYTQADMERLAEGKYLSDMQATMENFFSVYPYDEYREYFNVYMVAAVSNEQGISIKNPPLTKDTKFGSSWEGKTGTEISCNYNLVTMYASYVGELKDVAIDDLTIILAINANVYAGTCAMYRGGLSISMCPVNDNYKEIVTHEVGGHGFAKLGDEYIYYKNTPMPDALKDAIREWKAWGFCVNIDLDSDITLTSWSSFDIPKYTANCEVENRVGTFEGADSYGLGIWRPENNSCMNDNIPYYNAPSRWAIVDRISRLCGLDITLQDYMDSEVIPAYPVAAASVRAGMPLAPLGRPVIMYE